MVAVLVHEVVGVAFVLLAHFLHNPLHIFFCEVSAAQNYGFSAEPKGIWRQMLLHMLPSDCTSGMTSRRFVANYVAQPMGLIMLLQVYVPNLNLHC